MSKEIMNSNLWNLPIDEHFKMLGEATMFDDDFDFVTEVMESDDIEEVKQALLSVYLGSSEKEIINYTNTLMETSEPHSKELCDKATDLYGRMIREFYKKMELDYDKFFAEDEMNEKQDSEESCDCGHHNQRDHEYADEHCHCHDCED